jgi:hypothetical protein
VWAAQMVRGSLCAPACQVDPFTYNPTEWGGGEAGGLGKVEWSESVLLTENFQLL